MKGKMHQMKKAAGGGTRANVPNDPTGSFADDKTPDVTYAGGDSNTATEAKIGRAHV